MSRHHKQLLAGCLCRTTRTCPHKIRAAGEELVKQRLVLDHASRPRNEVRVGEDEVEDWALGEAHEGEVRIGRGGTDEARG